MWIRPEKGNRSGSDVLENTVPDLTKTPGSGSPYSREGPGAGRLGSWAPSGPPYSNINYRVPDRGLIVFDASFGQKVKK